MALTLVGGGLRFATLDVQGFDSDEAFGVSRVLDGSLTAVIPVVYLAGRELATRRAGLVAAAFAAVNPLLIFYAQEARNFALLTLCASLSIWFLARVLQEPSWRRLALWSGACVLAVSVHYFAGFLFVAEVAVLIAFVRPRPPAVLAALSPVVVSLAFTPLALSQADGRTEWISNQPLLTRAHQVVSKFFVGDVDPISNGLLLLIAVPLVTAIGYGLAISGPRERRGGLIALALAGGAVALTLAVDVAGGRYLIARNVIWALPATLVGIGAFLGAHRAGRWGPRSRDRLRTVARDSSSHATGPTPPAPGLPWRGRSDRSSKPGHGARDPLLRKGADRALSPRRDRTAWICVSREAGRSRR